MALPLSLEKRSTKLPDGVGRPAYARADLSAGIVHFGIGNFHRAHLQVYLDRLMNVGRDHDSAIVGAGVTPYDVRCATPSPARTGSRPWSSSRPRIPPPRSPA